MPKYKAVVEVVINVEADTKRIARILLGRNQPYIEVCGAGIDLGGYTLQSGRTKLIRVDKVS